MNYFQIRKSMKYNTKFLRERERERENNSQKGFTVLSGPFNGRREWVEIARVGGDS